MAIALDNVTQGSTGTGNSTLTISHAVGGTKTGLFVYVQCQDTSAGALSVSISGATYDGVAMTDCSLNGSFDSGSGKFITKTFYLPNPATGTEDVVVTLSGNLDTNESASAICVSLNGVDTTDPFGAGNLEVEDNGNSTSVTTTRANSWVLAFNSWQSGTATLDGTELVGGDSTTPVGYYKTTTTVGSYGFTRTTSLSLSGVTVVEALVFNNTISLAESSTVSDSISALRARTTRATDTSNLTDTIDADVDTNVWDNPTDKNAISPTNTAKNSASALNVDKNTESWANVNKS